MRVQKRKKGNNTKGALSEHREKSELHAQQCIEEKLSRPVSSLMQGKGWTKAIRERTLNSFEFMGMTTVGDLLKLSQDELFEKESRHKSKDSILLIAIWKLIKEIDALGLSFREDHKSKTHSSHSTKNRDNEAKEQEGLSRFVSEGFDEKLVRPVSFLFKLRDWPDSIAKETTATLETGGIRTIGDLVRLTYPEFLNTIFQDKNGNPISLPLKLRNKIQKSVLRSNLCFGMAKKRIPSFEEAGISKRTIKIASQNGLYNVSDLSRLFEIWQKLGTSAFLELRSLFTVFLDSRTY
jgi:hypothetical protein